MRPPVAGESLIPAPVQGVRRASSRRRTRGAARAVPLAAGRYAPLPAAACHCAPTRHSRPLPATVCHRRGAKHVCAGRCSARSSC